LLRAQRDPSPLFGAGAGKLADTALFWKGVSREGTDEGEKRQRRGEQKGQGKREVRMGP
jgi:hypothetical protein